MTIDMVMHTSADLEPLSLFLNPRREAKPLASKEHTLIERFPHIYTSDSIGMAFDRSPLVLTPRRWVKCCCSIGFGDLWPLFIHGVRTIDGELTKSSPQEVAQKCINRAHSFRTIDAELMTPVAMPALRLSKILSMYFSDWRIISGTTKAFEVWKNGFPICRNQKQLYQHLGVVLPNDVPFTLTQFLTTAESHARDLNNEYVGDEHLLLAMLDDPSCASLLESVVSLDRLRSACSRFRFKRPLEERIPFFTPRVKSVIEYASLDAEYAGYCVSPQCILRTLIKGDSVAVFLLVESGCAIDRLRDLVGNNNATS
jgi:hypothetical protein